MLDKNVIINATNKSFTKFSDAVTAELHSKLANNDDMKQYVAEYDAIQDMKVKFSEIGKTTED